MVSRVRPRAGAAVRGGHEKFDFWHPMQLTGGCPVVRRFEDPTLGVGKPSLRSPWTCRSQAQTLGHHRAPGCHKEPALGSPGPSWRPGTAGSSSGCCLAGSGQGRREKVRRRELPGRFLGEERILLCSDWLLGMAWWLCLGKQRGLPQEVRCMAH